MTKYYTMKECFDECGDEDVPFVKDEWNDPGDIQLTKENLLRNNLFGRLTWKIALSEKWQIKRAEPKVFTAYEWVNKSETSDGPLRESGVRIVALAQNAFSAGDKNGQLREWMRPEQVELREAVKSIVERSAIHSRIQDRLKKALDNLKPPKGVN